MFGYQSNYPQSNYPQSYNSSGGYDVNSGPPPPPPGVNQGYGQTYSAYNNYTGYGAGVPGFSCPSVQSMHSTYPCGNQPPPQLPPPQTYSHTPYMQARMEMDAQRQMYQQMGYSAPKPATPPTASTGQRRAETPEQQQEKPSGKAIDEDVKEKIRNFFIDELMRRYAVSATFEMASGTVCPMVTYPADDPVVRFYNKDRGEDLANQKWDAEADCEYLRKAMKGLGTDESIITHIVSTRCNAQRQRLKEQFKTMYGRDLIEDIKSELSGDYKDSILSCFVSPAYYDAWCIKKAIYGLGTDEQALIEIVMTRTNRQIKEMRAVYGDVARPNKKTKNTVIEDDIKGDTSGDFKRLLISASQGNRYEINRQELDGAVEEILNAAGQGTGMYEVNYSKLCDLRKAKNDAKRLFEAGEDRWGTDEETFNLIFSTRNFYQLRETYNQYVKLTQADILNAVEGETSGSFRRGLTAVVESVQNRPKYFANKLMKSMKGLGTDETTLIRIVASRSEIDMVQIKQEFLLLTKKTLWRYIKEDTSYNFKKFLQALVGRD